jgi:low affinity Fe/Cu permease
VPYIGNNGRYLPSFARWCERQVGRAGACITAIAFVICWLAAGPTLGWSDTWQLIINTASSVLTLVMVFVIQHGQRRDTQAIHLKLDELIRVSREARNELIGLEAKSETVTHQIRSAFEEMKRRSNSHSPCGGISKI